MLFFSFSFFALAILRSAPDVGPPHVGDGKPQGYETLVYLFRCFFL